MGIACQLGILLMMLGICSQVYSGQIYGGHRAVPFSRPYMVLLERFNKNQPRRYCDGFLLSEDFVMTAAHCQSSYYYVRLGVNSVFKDSEQRIAVKQDCPHKDFDKESYVNDLMLLKLAKKVVFSEHVTPIKLPDPGNDTFPEHCLVAGWGVSDRNVCHASSILMEVNVTIVNLHDCEKDYLYCSTGKGGPAKGDSGGPLVCDGKAYGVVSWSTADPVIYAYTQIPHFRRWIDGILNSTRQTNKDICHY